jgi:hypothetical protein
MDKLDAPPMVALLSQAFVAFAIEADNEFERRQVRLSAGDPRRHHRRRAS